MAEQWNRTTILWAMWGWMYEGDADKAVTRIRVSKLPAIHAYHICTQIKIQAEQNRKMTVTVVFNESSHPLSYNDWQSVERSLSYLDLALHKNLTCTVIDRTDCVITLEVRLKDRIPFCDQAVEFAIELSKVLGIEDKHRRIMGNFTVTQETQVRQDEGWFPFSSELRKRFNLEPPFIGSSGN